MVPGSTLRYGSNFIMFTRRPRLSSKQPIDAAASPLPKLDTTPPVTKTYFADIDATSSLECWGWEYLVGTIKYDRTRVPKGMPAAPFSGHATASRSPCSLHLF